MAKQDTKSRPKRTWFDCVCGNRITTNHFPLRCQKQGCGKVWVDRATSVDEGWELVSNDQLVNVVCRRFLDDAPPGAGLKFAVMAAVPSSDREDCLRRLKQKYGKDGDGIPWEHVDRLGHIHGAPVDVSLDEDGQPVAPRPTSHGRAEETGQKAAELRRAGLNWAAVGRELGMSGSYVRNAAFKVCGGDPKDIKE